MTIGLPRLLLLCSLATLWLSGGAARAATGDAHPCGSVSGWSPGPPATEGPGHGLTPDEFGLLVYDSNQGVCWLADANLAGHPEVRAVVPLAPANPDGSLPVINPDGTMDWETALNWVSALNGFDHGRGWLGHNNWQLPTNPAMDLSCSSYNNANFGAQCTGSALGNLYTVGLGQQYPNSVVRHLYSVVWPFLNLQPGLYWSADSDGNGERTFSFNTGAIGSNTTKYNLMRILPMTQTMLGGVPEGQTGVVPYVSGPGAGKAVYDTASGLSWPIDANLPAANNFGVTQTISVSAGMSGNNNGGTVTLPLVDADGSVYLSIANDPAPCLLGGNTSGLTSQWIVAMNASGYAGSSDWQLPCRSDLQELYADMQITTGDIRLEWPYTVGPFWRLQPGFYWACARADGAGSNGPCDLSQSSAGGLEWTFDFDDGFEGTDLTNKQFYVMVNFPAQ